MKLKTNNGKPFAEGGEANIWELADNPNRLLKVYRTPKRAAAREDKVKEMCKPELQAKLPNNMILPKKVVNLNGKFAGFTMDKSEGLFNLNELFLYPYKPVIEKHINSRQKIRMAWSYADSIDKLNARGCVLGDGNPNNCLVMKDSTLEFVDTDSVGIPGYPALGCVQLLQPPAMLSGHVKELSELTDRHMVFRMVFGLLNNGYSPYFCTKTSRNIFECHKRGLNSYFGETEGVEPAPAMLLMNDFPPYIRQAFERCLDDRGRVDLSQYPTASEWKKLLVRYYRDTKCCKHNKNHYYWKDLNYCPYCAAEFRLKNSQAHNSLQCCG